MKIYWFLALFAAVFFLGCSNGKEFVLYSWSSMFPQEILDGFEKETGNKVRYVNFDTNETMFTKLQTAEGGTYDLVIADDYMVENVIREGLAAKLDISRLDNYKNINSLYQKQFFDPADEYTIPYGAGVQTIVYDPNRVSVAITGYGSLWNPALAGSIGIIDNFRVINGMTLKVMGESYNTTNPQAITAAGEYLKSLAPNIRLIRDDGLENELLSGEITAGVMYTSQVTNAKLANPNLSVVFPSEGIGFGIMAAFIPSGAPNPDAAYAFLDYILDAEQGARCFEALGYYSTFAASDPYIKPEYREFLTLPQNLRNISGFEMIQNVDPETEALHSRVWMEFKSQAGR